MVMHICVNLNETYESKWQILGKIKLRGLILHNQVLSLTLVALTLDICIITNVLV